MQLANQTVINMVATGLSGAVTILPTEGFYPYTSTFTVTETAQCAGALVLASPTVLTTVPGVTSQMQGALVYATGGATPFPATANCALTVTDGVGNHVSIQVSLTTGSGFAR